SSSALGSDLPQPGRPPEAEVSLAGPGSLSGFSGELRRPNWISRNERSVTFPGSAAGRDRYEGLAPFGSRPRASVDCEAITRCPITRCLTPRFGHLVSSPRSVTVVVATGDQAAFGTRCLASRRSFKRALSRRSWNAPEAFVAQPAGSVRTPGR